MRPSSPSGGALQALEAEAQLRDFEEKTGCIAREEAVRAACGQIGSAAHALLAVPGAEEAARQILAAVDKIKE